MCWNKQSKISPSVVDNETPQTPWKSIIIVGCFTFCFAAQFTLYFSSMWPFLQILDNTANENFYGIIVSAYSLGQILSGPLVGLWATRTKSIVNPAHFCLMLSLTGNIIYVIASVLPSGQKEYILLARFFVGMGESSFSLYQGFASTASTHQDRSKALAITTGGIALGFSFGPAIQLLFTPLGFPGYNIYGKLWINMYTSPAIACCFINIICMLGLRLLFVEKYAGLANPNAKTKQEKKIHVPKYDKLAVGVCHLTRFIQLFAFTTIETIGTPLVKHVFALSSQLTVQYLSIAHFISGMLGFASYMFHVFQKKEIIDHRKLCLLGFIGFLLFYILTFPWPFNSGQLKTYSDLEYAAYKLTNNTGIEPRGCPRDQFTWCESTGTMNFWIYMIMTVLTIGLFWPNVNVSVSTLLSKILGPRRQANQQSLFQMSGSLARLIGPVLMSYIYTAHGIAYSWIFEICVLVFLISVWIILYNRIVPLKMPDPNQPIPAPLDDESASDFDENENTYSIARF